MSKSKRKSQDLQFIYEEDDATPEQNEKTGTNVAPEDLGDLEFSAATIIKENPLISNSDEVMEAPVAESADEDIEMTEEAKSQNTASVVNISDRKLEKEEAPIKEKVKRERTKTNIKAQRPEKVKKPTPKIVEPVDEFDDDELDFSDGICDLLDSDALEQIWSVKNDADVRVAVAEFKSEFLSEYMAEVKVLEFKINQLLKPLAKVKNAAIQKQVLKIQKVVKEHAKGTTTLIKESKKQKSQELPSQKIKTKKAA